MNVAHAWRVVCFLLKEKNLRAFLFDKQMAPKELNYN